MDRDSVINTAANSVGVRNTNRFRIWITVCIFVFGVAAATAPAQTFQTLVTFNGSNGQYPNSPLVQGTDGNFYGTSSGGALLPNCGNSDGYGCGIVFRMTPKGELATLYTFCAQANCTDGAFPTSFIQGFDGNFYGTTFQGGSVFGDCVGQTCGVMFKLTPAGTETVVLIFLGYGGGGFDAGGPQGLLQGPDGTLYGFTSEGGGGPVCGEYGCGSVFAVTPNGNTRECGFDVAPCQASSWTPDSLTLGVDGSLYGTSSGIRPPGTYDCSTNPCGSIFRITPSYDLSLLYSFTEPTSPVSLMQADDGNFYGSTQLGGPKEDGEVFKVTPAGKVSVVHTFCSLTNCADGARPSALVQGNDGNLYGTTASGGANGCGTVFKLTSTGTLTTLYSFPEAYGKNPKGALAQGTDSAFYGTTGFNTGGILSNNGTIYRLSTGLGRFVLARPGAATVRSTVTILGDDLTGTSSVRFNGKQAAFTVLSSTEITAEVPAGATTGKIGITTADGNLISNLKFHVIPQILSISPTSGPDGTTVTIKGESFSQVAAVTLAYQYPMSFTVDSDTQITATIPADAATGEISVRSPGGTAHSSTKFTVTQ